MREIKFRGKTVKGQTAFGDLSHFNGHVFINDDRVEPDSVAQFCGLDCNGEEVYEGDEVIAHGKEYTAYGLFKDLTRCAKKIATEPAPF